MKARYFRDDNILDAKQRVKHSYGWASVLAGLEIIKKGSRFIIGDGELVRLDNDNVVPTHPPQPIRSINGSSDITIKELISNTGSYRFWNKNAIRDKVILEDRNIFEQFHLPQCIQSDKLVWHYNKTGEYTVRSGYWLATHEHQYLAARPEVPLGSLTMKNSIWKLSTIPKIKHFLWRASTKALATTTRLNTRGMKLDPKCPRCCLANETINHVLFTCPFATMIWRLSNVPLHSLQSPSANYESNLLKVLDLQKMQGLETEQKLLPLWLLWHIWKARNKYIFNMIRMSPSMVVLQARAEVHEWVDNLQSREVYDQALALDQIEQHWRRPPTPFLKCNYDAGFDPLTHQVTGGWILRDDRGNAKFWGASRLPNAITPFEAEAKSLLAAMQQVWIHGHTSVIFEGDCQNLTKMINGEYYDITIDGIYQDIFVMGS